MEQKEKPLSQRDALYNDILAVIEKHEDTPIALVHAVLAEVDGEICGKLHMQHVSVLAGRLEYRKPRPMKQTGRAGDYGSL